MQATQDDLIKILQTKVFGKVKLVDQLAECLNLSTQGAYKKIQSKSKLTFNEIRDICLHFGCSFDELIIDKSDHQTAYPFYSDALRFNPNSINEYWENILDHLQKVTYLTDPSGMYFCNEIPFFYYIQFPSLLYFKMYMWNRTNWQIENVDNLYDPISFKNNKPLFNTILSIGLIYHQYPSVEIWNPDMLRLTMMQINYAIKSGYINSKSDLVDILDDMDKMIQHMENLSNLGYKTMFGQQKRGDSLDIYINEISINSEVIYIKSKEARILYNKYDSPNYLRSSDYRVCDHAEIWLNNIVSHSTSISVKGDSARQRFFKNIYEDLDNYSTKALSLFDAYI